MSLRSFYEMVGKIITAKKHHKNLPVYILIPDEENETETRGSGVIIPIKGMATVNDHTEGEELCVISLPNIKTVKRALDEYLKLKGLKRDESTKPN